MNRYYALVLLCTAAVLPAPAHAQAQAQASKEIANIQAQVAEAYGGLEAMEAFSGFHARGSVLSLADGLNGKLRLDVSLEGDLRAEISYPRRKEVRILAGPLAWNGGHHQQRPSSRDMADSMRLQYHRLAAPFELVEADPSKLTLVIPDEDGRVWIRREWSRRTRTIYEIDAKSGRILKVRGEIGQGDDRLFFETEAHDFRPVEGVLFPFRMTTLVGGAVAAETVLDRITHRERFKPDRFLPEGASGDM